LRSLKSSTTSRTLKARDDRRTRAFMCANTLPREVSRTPDNPSLYSIRVFIYTQASRTKSTELAPPLLDRPRSGAAGYDPLSPYSASPAAASDRRQYKLIVRSKRLGEENTNTGPPESNSAAIEETVTDCSSREPSYIDPNNRCFYSTPMVQNSIEVNTGGGLPVRFYSPEEESLFVGPIVCENAIVEEQGSSREKGYNSG
jgi:hypothetical protein